MNSTAGPRIGDALSTRNDSLAGTGFTCTVCKRGFQVFDDYYNHMEQTNHHLPSLNQQPQAVDLNIPPTFYCNLCHEHLPDYAQLKTHVEQNFHYFPPARDAHRASAHA